MNGSNSSADSGGVGFIGLLTIVFIVLKLTHVIDWSWWIVFLPLIIGVAVVIMVIAVLPISILCKSKKRRK